MTNETIDKLVRELLSDECNHLDEWGKIVLFAAFDKESIYWEKERTNNLEYLKNCENYFNVALRNEGCVVLNDVLKMLGLPKTKIGQIVGWVYDENLSGCDQICFDVFEHTRTSDDQDWSASIAFHVDGEILSKI